jgi:hypothetical protein
MVAPVVAPEETEASEVLVQLDKAMTVVQALSPISAAAVVVSLRLAAAGPVVMALPTLF